MADFVPALIIFFGFTIAIFKLKNFVRILSVLFKYKLVSMFIFPLILLSLWVFLSVKEIYHLDNVFLQLTNEYNHDQLINPDFTELTQGEKIQGQFTARENHLGIVAIRFWNFYRLNDDYVSFRIREKTQLDWYYQNSHKVDQFQPHGLFPFGFPVIPDSAGKTYVFEAESTTGSTGNAIGLSPIEPVFAARFKYPRQLVFSSLSNLIDFLTRKFIDLLLTPKFVASSFIYLLPFLLYVPYLLGNVFARSLVKLLKSRALQIDEEIGHFRSFLKHHLYKFLFWFSLTIAHAVQDEQSSPRISKFLVFLAIGLDIFWIRREDSTVVMLVVLWVVLIKIYSVSLKTTYSLALILFLLSFITWYIGDVNTQFASERTLAWALLFVTISTVQMTVDLNQK